MPTRPGHWPDQLATVRIGPEWVVSPGSTWLEYCQTASATTSGTSGSIVSNTSSPSRALAMKPWPRAFDAVWPRSSFQPAAAKALVRSASIACWAGQQTRLASSRRSPLAMSTARRLPAAGGLGDDERDGVDMVESLARWQESPQKTGRSRTGRPKWNRTVSRNYTRRPCRQTLPKCLRSVACLVRWFAARFSSRVEPPWRPQ